MSSIKHRIKLVCYRCLHSCISLMCPVKKKKMLCRSFLGLSYSDNPRAISERMHKLDPEWEIVWAFKEPEEKKAVVPSYVKCISVKSLAFIYHQATAGFWIDNYCLPLETLKRKGQTYIQTWHGDRGMKKILADMCADKDSIHIYESEHCDLAIAGSKFGENSYRSAFKYTGEILSKGCPKNDVLVNGNPEEVYKFKQLYNIPSDVKVLLFAPTFRDDKSSTRQSVNGLDMGTVLDALEKTTGYKWIVLSRGHTGRHLEFKKNDAVTVIDATDYEDSNIVLLSSDAVISDYGSIPTDFALLGRPVYFFVNDIDDYSKNSRSLRFKFEDTPFWYAYNQDDLIRLIEKTTDENAKEHCKAILDYYETHESGQASLAVCKYMTDRIQSSYTLEERKHV